MDDIAREDGDDESVDNDRPSRLQAKRAEVDLAALWDRGREVLQLALTGLSARAIAKRLTLTEATIRSAARLGGRMAPR